MYSPLSQSMIPRGNLPSIAMDNNQGFDTCINSDNGVVGDTMEVELNPPLSPIVTLHAPQEQEVKQDVKAVTKAKKRRLMTGAGGSKKSSVKKGKGNSKSK